MAYIYKITNDFDNKIYIGKTTRNVEVRFLEHFKKTSDSNSYIDNDMADKGIEHFKYEILEECSTDILSEREKYWINFYHSYIKDPECKGGYNLTPGGDGISLSEKQIQDIRQLWEQGENIKNIAKKLNISHSTVYHRVCQYDDFNKEENHKRSTQQYWVPVKQYDLSGKYIKTFESVSQAANFIQASSGEISYAAKNHTVCHNFRWSYENEELKISKNTKTVAQIDLKTGKIINIYEGAREAARQMNYKDAAGIIKTCNGKQKTCKGYGWKYIDG